MIEKCKCLKCGHEWVPRSLGIPASCPRCKNYNWDKPKKEMKKGRNK